MLSCLLKFLGFKNIHKIHASMENDFSDFLIPENYVNKDSLYLIYDSIKALLQADITVSKRSKEIIGDFFIKFDWNTLEMNNNRVFTTDIGTKVVYEFLVSHSSDRALVAKIELLFNIARSFTENLNGRVGSTKECFGLLIRVFFTSLIKRSSTLFQENQVLFQEISSCRHREHEITLKKLKKLNSILEDIKKFYLQVKFNSEHQARDKCRDLMRLTNLLHDYNQLSTKPNKAISELVIILQCYCNILYEAQKIKKNKRGDKIDYLKLDASITNLIIYFFQYFTSKDVGAFDVVFRRCLTPLNIKNFHIIKTNIPFIKPVNFFKLDHKNFHFKIFIEFVQSSFSLCEEINPYKDFRIINRQAMNNILLTFETTIRLILSLDIDHLIDEAFLDKCDLFLSRPQDQRLQKSFFNELFKPEEMKDMILFKMISEAVESEEEYESTLENLDTNVDQPNSEFNVTLEGFQGGDIPSGFLIASREDSFQELDIN